MAKLTRVTAVPFGALGTTDDFETFGSTAVGSTDYSKDLAAIQATDAWSNGWRPALVTAKAPVLQDMNAFCLVDSYQIAYLLQEGVPEYDSGTTYYTGDVVKRTGTFEVYGSLVDSNTGNALPSQTSDANWKYLGVLSSLANTVQQLLMANTASTTTSTSSTYTACGPSQAITMKNAANKVRVRVTGSVRIVDSNATTVTMTIKRDTTDLAPTSAGLIILQAIGVAEVNIPISMEWVDSPGDKSAHTYQAFFKNGNNSTSMVYPINGQAVITVEEIGAGA